MDSVGSTPASQGSHNQSQSAPSNGPQVRARITVVCGECKRLKLKCDRKTPCGSCQKRDTVPRCVYSAAAAEKVDLHSLNNRVSALESQMAEVHSGPQHTHSNQDQDRGHDQNHTQNRSHNHGQNHGHGSCSDDGPLIALGPNGVSVLVPSEDATQLWLNMLNLPPNLTTIAVSSSSPIKSEPSDTPSPGSSISHSKPPALLAPHPSLYYTNFPHATEEPQISPELVHLYLPPAPSRARLWAAACSVLAAHPGVLPFAGSWKERVDAMFKWADTTAGSGVAGGDKRAEAARILLFKPQSSGSVAVGQRPTVSFYAATAAVFALGAQALGGAPSTSARSSKKSAGGPSNSKRSKATNGSPAPELKSPVDGTSPTALLALSEQASDLFERSCAGAHDLDYVTALQLRALCMLCDNAKERAARVHGRVYSLVGQMVCVARMMGLGRDASEGSGGEARWTVWEEEARRRVWWGVFLWDLHISDSLGHPPLIADNTSTTRLPTGVDEAAFGPSSSAAPEPREDDHAAGFFPVKIRLAKLVKRTKASLFREADAEPLSIDDAFACHTDVKHFLDNLPPAFHLDGPADIAQRCELSMTAQRLILQIYLPFLRAPHANTAGQSHATVEAVQAAHGIVQASQQLHSSPAQSKNAMMEGYQYGQALFGAAVVCAHAVTGDSNAIWAREGLADVRTALELLRAIGGGEAVRVVEALLAKVEASVAGTSSVAGLKRKRGEMEDEAMEMPVGFCLPYAGPGVAISGEARDEPDLPRAETPPVEVRPSHSPEVDRRPPTGDKTKGKTKEKKVTHPSHGVRRRSAEDGPPYMRDKLEGSISATASSTSASEVELRLPSATPAPGNQFAYPMSTGTPAYDQPLSADLMPPPPSEYHVPFAAAQPVRPFSADHGPHQGYSPVAMDPSQTNFQGPSSSPASYDTGSSGQSPASAGFNPNVAQGFMSRPDHYPAQVYPQSYEVNHHQPISLHVDGMGGPPHVQYEEQKPYSVAPQYQPYDQNQNRSWDQSHDSQQQQQFWPQNGFYQT